MRAIGGSAEANGDVYVVASEAHQRVREQEPLAHLGMPSRELVEPTT